MKEKLEAAFRSDFHLSTGMPMSTCSLQYITPVCSVAKRNNELNSHLQLIWQTNELMNEFVMLPLIVPWGPTLWSSREREGERPTAANGFNVILFTVASQNSLVPKEISKIIYLKPPLKPHFTCNIFKAFKFTHSVNNKCINQKKDSVTVYFSISKCLKDLFTLSGTPSNIAE